MRGAGIEMRMQLFSLPVNRRRSPCGERGLKLLSISSVISSPMSLPMRGAGIEISLIVWLMVSIVVAPHAGSGD